MPDVHITRPEIAEYLDLTARQITNLVKTCHLADGTPFPSRVEGRSRTFPRRRCFEWYIRWKQEEALKRAAPQDTSDLADAEKRKAIADAELAELKLARLRAEVVPIADYRAELSRVLGNVRARMLAAPGEYASRLPVEMAVAVKLLREIMADVMVELQRAGEDGDDGDVEDEAA